MKIEGKKILVTGGSGMIGRYLVDLLLEEGASEITIASLDKVSDLPENVILVNISGVHNQKIGARDSIVSVD